MILKNIGLVKANIVLQIVNEMLAEEDFDFAATAGCVKFGEDIQGLMFGIEGHGNVTISNTELGAISVCTCFPLEDNEWEFQDFGAFDYSAVAEYVVSLIRDRVKVGC